MHFPSKVVCCFLKNQLKWSSMVPAHLNQWAVIQLILISFPLFFYIYICIIMWLIVFENFHCRTFYFITFQKKRIKTFVVSIELLLQNTRDCGLNSSAPKHQSLSTILCCSSFAKAMADKPHAVLIPLPFQSRIKSMLKLAKLLHHRGFHITFVNTEYNHI